MSSDFSDTPAKAGAPSGTGGSTGGNACDQTGQEALQAVIRDMSTGFRAEAPLPALLDRIFLADQRLWRLWDLGWRALRRLAPALAVDRLPGERPVVAVDLMPLLPGGANGGAKVFTLLLLETMAAMAPDWTFILVANPSPAAARAIKDELADLACANILVTQATRFWYLKPPKKLLGRTIDLWFCPFTRPYFQDRSIPLVSVIYDLQYHYYPQFFSEAERRGRDQTFQLASRRAARLACISEYVRGTVLEYGNLPPAMVRTIPIRLPKRLTAPPESETTAVLERFGLARQGYLLYPANFWPHKNHAMLLTAFGLHVAAADGADTAAGADAGHGVGADSALGTGAGPGSGAGAGAGLKLVLTGADTGLAAELKRAAKSMGLGERVLFTGYVSDEELAALTVGSLALIFPSLFEGYGMPVAEAMSLGAPVLCSEVTSLPEVGGDAVLYFDPRKPEDMARAIGRIATEPGLAAELGRKGLERLPVLGGPQDMAREYLSLLDEALRGLGRQSMAVSGVAAQGVSPAVFAAFGPAAGRQWIEAGFDLAPQAAPVTWRATLNGKILGLPATLRPGGSINLKRLASPYGGCLELTFDAPSGCAVIQGLTCRKLVLTGSRTIDLLRSQAC